MTRWKTATGVLPIRATALVAAIIVIGLATAAQGDDGDPLIIGASNQSSGDGTFTDWNVSGVAAADLWGFRIVSDGTSVTPLRLVASDVNPNPALSLVGNNIAVEASGKVVLRDRSGTAIVPADANRVTVRVQSSMNPVSGSTLVLATVQQTAGGAMVRAAVPNALEETFTIYLSKTATVKTRVAWTLIN